MTNVRRTNVCRLVRRLILALGITTAMFGQTATSVLPTLPPPGVDVIVSTGASVNFAGGSASSLSSASFRVASLAGLPTYATTTYEMTGAGLRAVQAGTTTLSNALTIKAGITQVVWRPKPSVSLFVLTQAGVASLSWAILGNFEGGAGLAWDLGGKLTAAKYHVYLMPVAREVAISGFQVKPVVGIEIATGFAK